MHPFGMLPVIVFGKSVVISGNELVHLLAKLGRGKS